MEQPTIITIHEMEDRPHIPRLKLVLDTRLFEGMQGLVVRISYFVVVRDSFFTLHASRFTLHASRFTLHASRKRMSSGRQGGNFSAWELAILEWNVIRWL